MADIFTQDQRSRVMSRIRGKWTLLDRRLHGALKSRKVRHKMYPKLLGNPDAVVYPSTLVFIDGCFWHGCPDCFVPPKSNKSYWRPKISRTRERDKKTRRALRSQGWKIVQFWEHQFLKKSAECVDRMLAVQRRESRSRMSASNS